MQFKLSFYLYKQNTFIQQKKCCATCIIQISLIFSYLFVNFYITFIKNKISHILLLCMYKNTKSLINKHKYFAIVRIQLMNMHKVSHNKWDTTKERLTAQFLSSCRLNFFLLYEYLKRLCYNS